MSLYRSSEDANAGANAAGAGFLAGVGKDGGPDHLVFVVPNRRVIEDGMRRVARLGSPSAPAQLLETQLDDWFRSERDDLAILPLNADAHRFDGRFITLDEFVSAEGIETHRIGTGDQVFMVSAVTLPEELRLVAPVALFG